MSRRAGPRPSAPSPPARGARIFPKRNLDPSLLVGLTLANTLRLGIAGEIRPKAKLKQGGYAADLVASGDAEVAVHQISEIVPVKGVVLVGPLPAEIQSFTTYAAAVGANAKDATAAKALIEHIAGPAATPILKARGMEKP